MPTMQRDEARMIHRNIRGSSFIKAETRMGTTHSPVQAEKTTRDVNVGVQLIFESRNAKKEAQIGERPSPLVMIPVHRAHSRVAPNGKRNTFERRMTPNDMRRQ